MLGRANFAARAEEPYGLSPLFVKEVIRVLGDLRRRGVALLVVEQNIGFLEIATRVFVLNGAASGSPAPSAK